MSKIEELIKNEKVEWKKLGEVCEIVRGVRVTKKDLVDNGEYPVVSGGIGYMGYINDYNRKEDTITIAQYGTAGYVRWQKEKFWANDVCFSVYPNDTVIKKFLYHFLLNKQEYLYSISNKSAIPYSISKEKILKIQIPIPSIKTQEKIVKILDKFTNYVTELQAELQARKKQYEYYRDELLGRKTVETEEVLLEDIATYSKERISANEVDEYSYVGVDNLLQEKRGKTVSSHVPMDGNLTKYYPGDILIGNIRPYLRKIWFADNIGGTNGDVLVIHVISDKVLPQYLYYNLSSERFFEYDTAKSKGAKMPRGDKNAVMKYNLLLPPIATQKRIVDVLNNFEKICNDLTSGIPAEISLRQKQYEYYRQKLLNFK